jgi:hypothetical protein
MLESEILAHPQLIKPLHGLNPRTLMGVNKWYKLRERVIKDNENTCYTCGSKNVPLECHEVYTYDWKECIVKLVRIVPLCKDCHNFIHFGRFQILRNQGKITELEFLRVYARGRDILLKNNISKDAVIKKIAKGDLNNYFPEKNGTWSRWRLEWRGTYYPSKFKTFYEWKQFYKLV